MSSALFEAVARFGGEMAPSSDEILSLASLQFPGVTDRSEGSEEDRQKEVKIFLKNVKDSLGPREYQIFLDLMVQIRQGYRADQPGLVVEKFDAIKGILTRENPELRLLLDRYFPLADALKRKELLEHSSIQQSNIQFQKWKVNYQSQMMSQSHSRRTPKPSNAGALQHRQSLYLDEPFPPLRSPNHFAPTPDLMRKRKHSALSPALQLQSIINRPPDSASHEDEHVFHPNHPSDLSPLEMLRLLATRQPPFPLTPSE